MEPELAFGKPRYYQIRVRGHLNQHWKEWLDGLKISYEKHGVTVLTGEVVDQPQLYGLLLKIRDLGLSLVSVTEMEVRSNEEHRVYKDEIVIGREFKLHSTIFQVDVYGLGFNEK